MSESKALAKQDRPEDPLKNYLLRAVPSISAITPRSIKFDAERMIRIASGACSRNRYLKMCTPISILGSIMQSSQLGLDIGGTLGHAYLVPFQNRYQDENGNWVKRWEAQCIPGYKGLIVLAWRSANIDISCHVVYEGDDFDYADGTNAFLRHRRCPTAARGKRIHAWALARFPDGRVKFEVMDEDELMAIKARSKAKNNGPWVTDEDQMIRKTVIKRLMNYLPIEGEQLQKAIEIDNRAHDGKITPYTGDLSIPEDDDMIEAEVVEEERSSAGIEAVKARGRKTKSKAEPDDMTDEERQVQAAADLFESQRGGR